MNAEGTIFLFLGLYSEIFSNPVFYESVIDFILNRQYFDLYSISSTHRCRLRATPSAGETILKYFIGQIETKTLIICNRS